MMRALVESTPDAVAITDSAGHVLMANPAFVSLVQHDSEGRIKGQGLPELVGDRDGAWRDTIARTRLLGLCPRTSLSVRHDQLTIAVEVSSTLLAEGDQEHLGFTLRTVEPPRPVSAASPQESWPELSALRAQVGLVSLDTLLREGAEVVERRLLQAALRLADGRVDVAARLLVIEPRALSQRLHRLDLATNGADDDPPAPTAPRRMN